MIVIAKLKAKKGKEEEVKKAVLNVLPKVEAEEEGTLVYAFNQSTNDPTQFVFYEKYADGDALKAHSTTAHFKEMAGALAHCLDGAPQIDMLTEIGAVNR